ncbi:TonB-dependent receptor [Aestuariicella sp. G3-2]|uniref:TonB-dependent receptor n=1 Tax=Pseudomaricurvus albidus TaxID=2842452 RepID=UPI001C0DD62F|nr:TonB-dependent receptor [Aestuariicella albida]MBU3068391.1 TonB-dependent receptor [Aestuariicella albida]
MFFRKPLAKEVAAIMTVAFTIPQVSLAKDLHIEEIVVTAQKRAQSMQDVGIAVSAFNGDELRELNWSDPSQIGAQTPNLDVKNTLGSGNPVITIRGVGLNDFNPNNSPTVGVYVDEVFLSSPAMLGFQLFDMERIEVLKGPQGTLYGRNTTGGAVSFVSRKPTEEFEAYVDVGYGNYQTFDLAGAVGGNLAENLNGRFAFTTTQRQGGHISNRTTGNDDYGQIDTVAWRAQLAWTPSDDLDILFGLHGGRDRSDAQTTWTSQGVLDASDPWSFELCDAVQAGSWDPASCSDVLGYSDDDGDPFTGDWNMEPVIEADSLGAVLNIRKDFENLSLISITGYESYERYLEEDADGSAAVGLDLYYDNELELWSQELRLVSDFSGSFNWIAGLYYSSDDIVADQNQYLNSTGWYDTDWLVRWKQKGSSAAAYVHTEWQFAESWKLTTGLRHTQEKKSFEGGTWDLNPLGASPFLDNPSTDGVVAYAYTDTDIKDRDLSGKISIDFTPNDDWLIYASYSKGYKSGGFSGGYAGSDDELAPYKPEELLALELGFKASLLDRTLQWNAAVFTYEYSDMQLFTTEVTNALTVLRLSNAEEARITGLDMDLWWKPAAGFDIKMGVGYLDTENKDDEYKGLELANAPELSVNGLVRYEWSMTPDYRLALVTDFNYQDSVFKTADNKPQLASESYTLWNANVILTPNSDQWSLSLWGKNLSNKEYVVEAFDQEGDGNYIFAYGMPRTYGVSLNYNWN